MKNEFREYRQKEFRWRQDMRETVENNEKDRQYISELTQQNNIRNQLHSTSPGETMSHDKIIHPN